MSVLRSIVRTLLVGALAVGTTFCTGTSRERSAAALDSTVAAIVRAYEAKEISLDSAAQQLANAVEPTGGLAATGHLSPRARELFEAAGRELARRGARQR